MDNITGNKITKEPQELIIDQFRPYDLWLSGRCPVCNQVYEGDAYNEVHEGRLILHIHCKKCNQVLIARKL